MAPIPLQDQEGQLQALQTLYEEAGEHKLASVDNGSPRIAG